MGLPAHRRLKTISFRSGPFQPSEAGNTAPDPPQKTLRSLPKTKNCHFRFSDFKMVLMFNHQFKFVCNICHYKMLPKGWSVPLPHPLNSNPYKQFNSRTRAIRRLMGIKVTVFQTITNHILLPGHLTWSSSDLMCNYAAFNLKTDTPLFIITIKIITTETQNYTWWVRQGFLGFEKQCFNKLALNTSLFVF